MANKKATHTVVHPKLYLAVEGKLQHIPKGTDIYLNKQSEKSLGKKVVLIGSSKTVEVGKTEAEERAEVEAKAEAEAKKAGQ